MTGGAGAFPGYYPGNPGYNPGYPGGYPTQPPGGLPPVSYLPNPGAPPWYNVGRPRFPVSPGYPGVPIVLNPTPLPEPLPDPSPEPNPDPGTPPDTTPTIPVGLPGTEVPDEYSLEFWSPWPLPPREKSSSADGTGQRRRVSGASNGRRNTQALQVSHSSDSERSPTQWRNNNNARQFDLVDGASPAPAEELRYRGGRLIRDLYYVNLYVSGDKEWTRPDVENIDSRLAAAMQDEGLNNVLLQYFENHSIRSTPLPSHPLVGYTPKHVSRGDIQNMIAFLHRQGFLESFDLQKTVFNLLLPPGTVLTVDDRAEIVVSHELSDQRSDRSTNAVPYEDGDSLTGLGGYHGSVATENNDRVYYAVSVYSERGANNTTNGIPVFREPWKNVVATLYHQLVESRTNPDVEEAMRHESDGTAEQYLGWVSASGLEVGDFPIRANIPLRNVFREVPLTNGSGAVPVQLIYSNAVQGPEGPISQPHPLR